MISRFVLVSGVAGLFLLIVAALGSAQPPDLAPAWQKKVDPWVLQRAGEQENTEFLVFMAEQAGLDHAAQLATRLEKGRYVYRQLRDTARRTQPPVLAALQDLNVEHRSFWIANMIWVRGSAETVQAMARRADVARVLANPGVPLEEPAPGAQLPPLAPAGVEWNVAQINAPDVWEEGITGQGVVVGGQDTGYDWDHAALKARYRGWNGSSADHDYNWHDAIHSNGGLCGPDSAQPCDDHGHGTHTMGTMIGDDGGSNQIGVAPGARWIGCRNMDQGVGTPATYSECFQWFVAPTDLNGNNPDPSQAPHVVNNSWACPPSEGCTDPSALQTVVQNARAAGIVVVASAGNEGAACETVQYAPAIYEDSFSVGATDGSDAIAPFSSRGPVTVDGSRRLKPDVVAPGVGVRSSVPGDGYGTSSGTSMAAPHLSGLVALLIAADPALAGAVDTLESVITDSAAPLTTVQDCGNLSGSYVPNYTYGYGRIDALSAYEIITPMSGQRLSVAKTSSQAQVVAGDTISYTIVVTHSHPTTPTHNVILTDVLPVGTSLVTATTPFVIDEDVLRWEKGSLDPAEIWEVDLQVRSHVMTEYTIVNAQYSVRSDESSAVYGDPVSVTLLPAERLYFPVTGGSGQSSTGLGP